MSGSIVASVARRGVFPDGPLIRRLVFSFLRVQPSRFADRIYSYSYDSLHCHSFRLCTRDCSGDNFTSERSYVFYEALFLYDFKRFLTYPIGCPFRVSSFRRLCVGFMSRTHVLEMNTGKRVRRVTDRFLVSS